jgi:hypothetical protein
MANKYLIDLDLNQNEIQNFAIQTTGTLPASPVNGQVVNHSGIIKVYDLASTSWKTIGAAADGTTITETSGVLSVGTIAQSNVSGLGTALGGKVSTTGNETIAGNKTFSNDVIVQGDLTVSGNVTSKLSEEVLIEDNMVILNSNETGTPSENAGIEVERGTSANASLFWAESQDRWYMSTGATTEAIPNSSDLAAAGSNDYVDGATFNSTNGELTLSVGAQSDVVVDLDGRYLTSYTETDPVFSASAAGSITSTQVTNWDTAYGWGDHSTAGYLTTVPNAGIGAGTYGDTADGTKIDTITVDAQGRVTAVATGPVVDNNTQRTDEEIRDLVADVMVSNGSHTGITATDDDAGNGVDLVNSYNYTELRVTGHTAGNLNVTSGTVNINFTQTANIQVYEDNGAGILTQVHTSVEIDVNNNEANIYLPSGDFKIGFQGARA